MTAHTDEGLLKLADCPFCCDQPAFTDVELKDDRRYAEKLLRCCSVEMSATLSFSQYKGMTDAQIDHILRSELVKNWNTRPASAQRSGVGEPVAIQPIDSEFQPEQAGYERDQLWQRIKQHGPKVVSSILLTYAKTQPPSGSFAGSLWAIGEWAASVAAPVPLSRCEVRSEDAEDSSLGYWPQMSWWEAASLNAEFVASLGEWKVTFRSPRGVDWRDAGIALRERKESPPAAQGSRPRDFLAWAVEMFGPVAKLRSERLMRFVEEAIELAHAEGMEQEVLGKIYHRVYSRPRGDTPKEIGQAQACLETFAENIGLSSADEAEREWQRVQGIPREEWTRRHSIKQAMGIALPSADGGPAA